MHVLVFGKHGNGQLLQRLSDRCLRIAGTLEQDTQAFPARNILDKCLCCFLVLAGGRDRNGVDIEDLCLFAVIGARRMHDLPGNVRAVFQCCRFPQSDPAHSDLSGVQHTNDRICAFIQLFHRWHVSICDQRLQIFDRAERLFGIQQASRIICIQIFRAILRCPRIDRTESIVIDQRRIADAKFVFMVNKRLAYLAELRPGETVFRHGDAKLIKHLFIVDPSITAAVDRQCVIRTVIGAVVIGRFPEIRIVIFGVCLQRADIERLQDTGIRKDRRIAALAGNQIRQFVAGRFGHDFCHVVRNLLVFHMDLRVRLFKGKDRCFILRIGIPALPDDRRLRCSRIPALFSSVFCLWSRVCCGIRASFGFCACCKHRQHQHAT